ncbi:MAG: M61 family peptidase [Candidatus Eremiobacteraeota bacterium]|nr:M61 family peptidase [Candidatus Eremiobacteraeota bacterium]
MNRLVIAGVAALAVSLVPALAVRAQGTPQLDAPLATQSNPMTVVLDARKAPLGIAYTHMTIPVKPGPFTLVYPQWIPGEHGPSGPLNDMSEIRITANGKSLWWQRDQVDMYAFHLTIPPGVNTIDTDFTVLLNDDRGPMATRNIMVGNWNRYILYQRNVDNQQYYVKPSIIMPDGWDYASALPDPTKAGGNRVDFGTVTLETLVDSPTDMGRFVKHVTTWTDGKYSTYLDLFGDKPEDLKVDDKVIQAYKNLTPEAIALYGGHHWDVYHAELTLSDALGFQGIEHHQSSDDRADDEFLVKPEYQAAGGDLVPHEFSHSWNGKYRRPFDLQQPNFNEPYPEHTELLWQYEGMNQYMGDLLSFRSGIRDPKDYPEYFASIYAEMFYEPGRETTPIIDTTTGAPYYYCCARGDYPSLRRTAGDFYTEGELMWLDVDTIIRQQTGGKKSIDDYTKLFAGGVSGPKVVTYTREDIENYLNQIAPYDWHGFFEKWVYSIASQPPTDEIERSGYKLVWNDKPNDFVLGRAMIFHGIPAWYDVGLQLNGKGNISDVRMGSAAWNAQLAPHMQIVAVNGRAFDPDIWKDAITDAKSSSAPIQLLVKQGSWYRNVDLNYHDGIKYPHLERIPGTTDMLSDIMKPHATSTPKP